MRRRAAAHHKPRDVVKLGRASSLTTFESHHCASLAAPCTSARVAHKVRDVGREYDANATSVLAVVSGIVVS